MTIIHLIRHARPATTWGGEDDDPGLDACGVDQAKAAAEALAALPPDIRPQHVASSPLRRCRETAAPLALRLGATVEIVPAVGEIPTPAHLAHAERSFWLRGALAGRWAEIEGDLDYEAWRRAVAAAVSARPRTAVFSHFVAINAVVSLLERADKVIAFRPDHASVTVLEVGAAGLRLSERGREAATSVL